MWGCRGSMKNKNIIIIGVGNVGFTLAYMLTLKSLEPNCEFTELTLIDNDVLEEHNLPYGLSSMHHSKSFINYPKVYAAEDQLLELNPKLKLQGIIGNYPDCLNKVKIKRQNNVYIDCRDDLSQDDRCYIKICSEGPYSTIIYYPENINSNHVSYNLKPSKYYTIFTVTKILNDICSINFNKKVKHKQKKYIINHLMDGNLNEI